MKKTVFMALSAIALVSVSCNNRDNDEPQTKTAEKTTEQKIIGNWYRAKYEVKYADKTEKFDENDCAKQSHWDFTADKKLVMTEFLLEGKGKEEKCKSETTEATYYLGNNKLTYKIKDTQQTDYSQQVNRFDIKELTDKNLVIEQKVDWNEDGVEDIVTTTFVKK